jgi:uncharacterized protein (DUF488 family)
MTKSSMRKANGVLVLTIGHSTRSINEFLEVLKANEVTLVADIRSIPRSRFNPQFDIDNLPVSLEIDGIKYIHMNGLGGLRHPRADSPNTGWKNSSFRGFADYMQTVEFEQNLEHLMGIIGGEMVVLMCAERLPWRCHRSLIADALLVRGFLVEHIIDLRRRYQHKLTSFARVQGTKINYPLMEMA